MDSKQPDVGTIDPVALTLALWLGLMVGVAGISRVSQEAASQAALDEAAGKPGFALTMDDAQLLAARTMAFGG